MSSVCSVCLDDSADCHLACSHSFHETCIEGLLAAKWTGLRINFKFMTCPLCREPIEHETASFRALLEDLLIFKEEVTEMARKKHQEEPDVLEEHDEVSDELLLETFAFYECCDCTEPFCGGLVSCAEELELELEDSKLRCQECVFKASGPSGDDDQKNEIEDRRCFEHGYTYAMFKCDSCCSMATWDCGSNHFCDRCHNIHGQEKNFKCPGPKEGVLGIAHPPNLPAVHGRDEIVPYVLGCMKCFGMDMANDDYGSSSTAAMAFENPEQIVVSS